VIVDTPTERALFRRSGVTGSVEDFRARRVTREFAAKFCQAEKRR